MSDANSLTDRLTLRGRDYTVAGRAGPGRASGADIPHAPRDPSDQRSPRSGGDPTAKEISTTADASHQLELQQRVNTKVKIDFMTTSEVRVITAI